MTLLQNQSAVTDRSLEDVRGRILDFIRQKRRVGFLVKSKSSWDLDLSLVETIRESILSQNGQFISLDAKEFDGISFPSVLLPALEEARGGKPFQIHLPLLLQNNPRVDSPFINRAILWQRLCDRLVEDDARLAAFAAL